MKKEKEIHRIELSDSDEIIVKNISKNYTVEMKIIKGQKVPHIIPSKEFSNWFENKTGVSIHEIHSCQTVKEGDNQSVLIYKKI